MKKENGFEVLGLFLLVAITVIIMAYIGII